MSYYIVTSGSHLVTDAMNAYLKWKEINNIQT